MPKNYIVAIGGAGVKTIFSMLHLCSCGYITEDLSILLIDTDSENGNTKLLDMVSKYYDELHNKLGGISDYFKSSIQYVKATHLFNNIQNIEEIIGNSTLAKAFLSENELSAKLSSGVYGMPALGSIAFCSCLDQEKYGNHGDRTTITDFLNHAFHQTHTDTVNLMFIGSIFGGTGASGILSLLQFVNRKAKAFAESTTNDLVFDAIKENLHVATCLILPYFTVADSARYNSWVDKSIYGLKYYLSQKDDAITECGSARIQLKNHYFIGYSTAVVRGEDHAQGFNQKNWPHEVEIGSCLACEHFFTRGYLHEKDYILCVPQSAKTLLYSGSKKRTQSVQTFTEFCLLYQHFLYPYLYPSEEDSVQLSRLPWYSKSLEKLAKAVDFKADMHTMYIYFSNFIEWRYKLIHPFQTAKDMDKDGPIIADNIEPDETLVAKTFSHNLQSDVNRKLLKEIKDSKLMQSHEQLWRALSGKEIDGFSNFIAAALKYKK